MASTEMPAFGISQVQILGLLTISLIAVVVVPNVATGLLGLGLWLFLVSMLFALPIGVKLSWCPWSLPVSWQVRDSPVCNIGKR